MYMTLRCFSTSAYLLQPKLDNVLIWQVDWNQVALGKYAIADPNDPGELIYLSTKEYLSFLKTSIANDSVLTVIAHPGESKPLDRDIKVEKPKFPPTVWAPRRITGWGGLGSHIRAKFSRSLSRETGLIIPSEGNLGKLLYAWGGALWLWNGLPPFSSSWFDSFGTIGSYLRKQLKHKGSKGVVLLLKTSLHVISLYLADPKSGKSRKGTWDLGFPVKLTNGLPQWLPLSARVAIRSGSAPTIQFWISFLSAYKAFQVPYEPSKVLESISSKPLEVSKPQVQSILTEFREFLVREFVPGLGGMRHLPKGTKGTMGTFTSAGPNGSPAVDCSGLDAAVYSKEDSQTPMVYRDEAGILQGTQLRKAILSLYHKCNMWETHVAPYSEVSEDGFSFFPFSKYVGKPVGILGTPGKLYEHFLRIGTERPIGHWKCSKHSKVTFIAEGGGKLRAIAILDWFSQTALKPLHEDLFYLLKNIPMDGTHDQDLLSKSLQGVQEHDCSLEDLVSVSQKPSKKTSLLSELVLKNAQFDPIGSDGGSLYWSSLDISKATDMIPRELYEIILDCLYGDKEFTRAVMITLTDREFQVNRECRFFPKEIGKKLPKTIRYTRGQPMGSLSSFALLGIWHHAWIQFAASRLGIKDFNTYGVCGDDSVIVDTEKSFPIASQYKALCDEMGIPISLPKSFQSSSFFNFLSRSFYKGREISPASLKEELQVTDIQGRLARSVRLCSRGFGKGKGSTWLTTAMKCMLSPTEYRRIRSSTPGGWYVNNLSKKILCSLIGPNFNFIRSLGFESFPFKAWFSCYTGDPTIGSQNLSLLQGQYNSPHIDEVLYRDLLLQLFISLQDEYWDKLIGLMTSIKSYPMWASYQSVALRDGQYKRVFEEYVEQLLLCPDYITALREHMVAFEHVSTPERFVMSEEVAGRYKEEALEGIEYASNLELENKITETIFSISDLPTIPDYSNPLMLKIELEKHQMKGTVYSRIPANARRLNTLMMLALNTITVNRGPKQSSQDRKI